jgi:hypothetical protein
MWDYNRINKQKEALCAKEGITGDLKDNFSDMGDDSPLFRYVMIIYLLDGNSERFSFQLHDLKRTKPKVALCVANSKAKGNIYLTHYHRFRRIICGIGLFICTTLILVCLC